MKRIIALAVCSRPSVPSPSASAPPWRPTSSSRRRLCRPARDHGTSSGAAFKAELTARRRRGRRRQADPRAGRQARGADRQRQGPRHRCPPGFAEKHKALVARIAKARGVRTAATYLGATPQELRAARQSGQSLAQIAAAKGKSVDGLVAAMVAPAKERAAKAVANGRLTPQRADELITKLTQRVRTLVQRVPAKA